MIEPSLKFIKDLENKLRFAYQKEQPANAPWFARWVSLFKFAIPAASAALIIGLFVYSPSLEVSLEKNTPTTQSDSIPMQSSGFQDSTDEGIENELMDTIETKEFEDINRDLTLVMSQL